MKLLLISNSTNYKEPYLSWCMPLLEEFLQKTAKKIVFIPYAGVDVGGKVYPESYEAYTERVQKVFKIFGKTIVSVHAAKDPVDLVNHADLIMVGGGNTFHLVAELHRNKLIEPIRRKVMEGTPYIGWSAGSNVACPTLCTTNDMPIVMPESFQCLDLVPFQINPHYIDPYPEEINDRIRHGGETRQVRLNEYLAVNQYKTVAGLREGTALWVENERITLRGTRNMIVLRYGKKPVEKKPGAEFGFDLK
ncbi:MAG: dipeptidase PepE [Bacteroidales bacterium]|nr:dipeptidase PepE [Bacteroidales bacterium]